MLYVFSSTRGRIRTIDTAQVQTIVQGSSGLTGQYRNGDGTVARYVADFDQGLIRKSWNIR